MRILFDNNVPLYLTREFPAHDVRTAFRQGWAALSNGNLLSAAEAAGFDVLVTLDRNFEHQQNLASKTLWVAILQSKDQSKAEFRKVAKALMQALGSARPGEIVVFGDGDDP